VRQPHPLGAAVVRWRDAWSLLIYLAAKLISTCLSKATTLSLADSLIQAAIRGYDARRESWGLSSLGRRNHPDSSR
jgi:hypothetical protein